MPSEIMGDDAYVNTLFMHDFFLIEKDISSFNIRKKMKSSNESKGYIYTIFLEIIVTCNSSMCHLLQLVVQICYNLNIVNVINFS